MKKDSSQSRSLRKRLLITLITCLLTVLIICASMFELIYKQTERNVDTHFSEFSDEAISVVSDSLYQRNMANMQTVLHCFCGQMSERLSGQYNEGLTFDYSFAYKSEARSYFKDAMMTNCIFFVISDIGIRTTDITTEESNDEKMLDAIRKNDGAQFDAVYRDIYNGEIWRSRYGLWYFTCVQERSECGKEL